MNVSTVCEAGSYCNASGLVASTLCAAGTFAATTNKTACDACTAGSYCAIGGLVAVTGQCAIDKFSLAGQQACTACARTQASALTLGSTSCVPAPITTLQIGAAVTSTSRAGRAVFFTVPVLPPTCRLTVTLTVTSGAAATLAASTNSLMPIPEQCATVGGDPLCQV
jgi:hypothetical protein